LIWEDLQEMGARCKMWEIHLSSPYFRTLQKSATNP